MGEIKLDGFICERCAHKWVSRNNGNSKPLVCPKCLPPETIISGDFKPILEYKVGSKAYTYSGQHLNVKNTFEHSFTGDLIEIKPHGCLPIRVTPEHRVLAIHAVQKSRSSKRRFQRKFEKPEWIFAEHLKKRPSAENRNDCGDYIVIPKLQGNYKEDGVSISEFSSEHGLKVLKGKKFPDYFPLNKNSAWLLGLYVAEGMASHNGELIFCLGKHERDLINEATRKVNSIGFKPNCYESKTALNVIFYSRMLSRAFKKWCGSSAKTKKIPHFILEHASPDILSSFLRGYIAGDGFIRKYKRRTYVTGNTTSKTLALQLQLLGARLGGFFNITTVDFSKYPSTAPDGHIIRGGLQYRVRTSSTTILKLFDEEGADRHNKSYKLFEKYIAVPINSITTSHYNGKVMNLETEEGNYLASNIVVKNCKSPYWNIPRKINTKKGESYGLFPSKSNKP